MGYLICFHITNRAYNNKNKTLLLLGHLFYKVNIYVWNIEHKITHNWVCRVLWVKEINRWVVFYIKSFCGICAIIVYVNRKLYTCTERKPIGASVKNRENYIFHIAFPVMLLSFYNIKMCYDYFPAREILIKYHETINYWAPFLQTSLFPLLNSSLKISNDSLQRNDI